ncbi:hypothetical protein GNY06_02780 [Elizabethkingia argentiflava]|uniref:Uncharacterized protein n=1 Tax=Elizabethkingia argenteiflava TaxID=2681556 RepID=A0A845PVM7_9FLAO|nr:hypothetical protein [Elizabethkingia argenteiflava]NAW50358.1 hypothetical protein [Elizabethkingia argenteiflava]
MKKLFFSALLLGLGTGATFAQVTNPQTAKSKSDASASPTEITQDKAKKNSETGISPGVKKEDEQSAVHHQKAAGQRRSYSREDMRHRER